MSAGYTKLFSSIVMSSIWEEDDQTRLVWVTMLALADQRGIVDGTVRSLARVARVSLECCEKALDLLSSPDPFDRSGVQEGRRIVPAQGGWQLVNHATYRHRLSLDERRERDKLRKRAVRAVLSAPCPQPSVFVRDVSQAEAEAKAEEEQDSGRAAPAVLRRPAQQVPGKLVREAVRQNTGAGAPECQDDKHEQAKAVKGASGWQNPADIAKTTLDPMLTSTEAPIVVPGASCAVFVSEVGNSGGENSPAPRSRSMDPPNGDNYRPILALGTSLLLAEPFADEADFRQGLKAACHRLRIDPSPPGETGVPAFARASAAAWASWRIARGARQGRGT